MKRMTLPPLAIAGIGAALCLILAVVIIFVMIHPAQDQLTAQQARYSAAYPDSTDQAQATARQQLAAAKVQVATTQRVWQADEVRYMPKYNVSKSLLTAWQEQTRELAYYLGPHIEQWIPTTGVVPLFTTVGLAAPVTDPNLVTNSPLILPITAGSAAGGGGASGGGFGGPPAGFGGPRGPGSMAGYTPGGGGGGGTGSLSVGGDFRRILYHIQRWNTFDRLVLIDGLALHGNSPFMSATYNATVFEFPQGSASPAAPLPKGASSGGGAAGPGGAMGGFGPGMGGPPPGFGGPPPGMGGPPPGVGG